MSSAPPESNQRPEDNNLYRLQSSALPIELGADPIEKGETFLGF